MGCSVVYFCFFFFSSRRRHTRCSRDWSSDVCSSDLPGPGELRQMKDLVAEAMNDGAFGLSTALMMPPSSLATTDDLVELAKVAAAHGSIYATHIRDEGLGVFDSIKEAIQIGERARLPVDILHIKIADEKYWGRMKEVVALIEDARRRGINV